MFWRGGRPTRAGHSFDDNVESKTGLRDHPERRAAVWRPIVKLAVYRHLLDLNTGFDQVVRSLAALQKHDAFLAKELDYYAALAKEARAATMSYLLNAMEGAETDEAGRRFGKRRERELKEK